MGTYLDRTKFEDWPSMNDVLALWRSDRIRDNPITGIFLVYRQAKPGIENVVRESGFSFRDEGKLYKPTHDLSILCSSIIYRGKEVSEAYQALNANIGRKYNCNVFGKKLTEGVPLLSLAQLSDSSKEFLIRQAYECYKELERGKSPAEDQQAEYSLGNKVVVVYNKLTSDIKSLPQLRKERSYLLVIASPDMWTTLTPVLAKAITEDFHVETPSSLSGKGYALESNILGGLYMTMGIPDGFFDGKAPIEAEYHDVTGSVNLSKGIDGLNDVERRIVIDILKSAGEEGATKTNNNVLAGMNRANLGYILFAFDQRNTGVVTDSATGLSSLEEVRLVGADVGDVPHSIFGIRYYGSPSGVQDAKTAMYYRVRENLKGRAISEGLGADLSLGIGEWTTEHRDQLADLVRKHLLIQGS